EEACMEGSRRFLLQPHLIHKVQEWERLLRTPLSYVPLAPMPLYARRPTTAGSDPWTVHYTELLPAEPDSPLAAEWETYRREVGRLLAEGHEGRHILIKGNEIIGIWDTDEEAYSEGRRRFPLEPILVHKIQERERMLRTRLSYL